MKYGQPDICQLLLAEDDVDSKDECHKQYKRKNE